MKLNLKKKSIKSLSSDNKKLPNAATPAVAGGTHSDYVCETAAYCNTNHCFTKKWNEGCNPQLYTYQGTGCCRTTLC
ncbi:MULTISPECIES: hypothetical protein [unclassified Pseudoalteromonas]|uniref:hypothetical protein n=1 Tax=unclassified Pseudoalteromonas TaxID=194690 RepID=UPI0020979FD8|nr:hypothetical protein [Pseudoalteromonas sp. XMcav2-N]MCO7186802.1 hypothetical protein [Pseudoalteromonas sp. XMcav2-N]